MNSQSQIFTGEHAERVSSSKVSGDKLSTIAEFLLCETEKLASKTHKYRVRNKCSHPRDIDSFYKNGDNFRQSISMATSIFIVLGLPKTGGYDDHEMRVRQSELPRSGKSVSVNLVKLVAAIDDVERGSLKRAVRIFYPETTEEDVECLTSSLTGVEYGSGRDFLMNSYRIRDRIKTLESNGF